VFCANGHLQIGTRCVSNYRIVGGHFIVYVELWPLEKSEKLPSIFAKTFTASDLQRSVLKQWDTYVIVAAEVGQTSTRFIIAVLKQTFASVNYSFVLGSVQQALSATWTLTFSNITVQFSAKIHRHIEYRDVYRDNIVSDFIIMEPSAGGSLGKQDAVKGKQYEYFMSKEQWNVLWTGSSSNGGRIMITKMSFCNLIELGDNEFTESREQITLNASNKTLAPGEFLRVVGIDGEIRTRICLEDLYPVDNSGVETDDLRGLIVLLHVFSLCCL